MKVYIIKKIIDGNKSKIIKAFTTSKELANEFIKSRKKGLYYLIDLDISENEYKKLEIDMTDYKIIVTFGVYTKYEDTVEECEIICTMNEYYLTTNRINEIIMSSVNISRNITILKDKYTKALSDLLYFKMRKMIMYPEVSIEPLYQADFAAVFIEIFGKEMNM